MAKRYSSKPSEKTPSSVSGQSKKSELNLEKDKNGNNHPLAKPFLFILSETCRRKTVYVLLLIVTITFILELIRPINSHVSGTHWTGFFAFYGFMAFSLVVLAGWPLAKLLRRKEQYYESGEEDLKE